MSVSKRDGELPHSESGYLISKSNSDLTTKDASL